MQVSLKADSQFKKLYRDTPKALKKVEGIDNLDPISTINQYFSEEKIADLSVDPNANISGKSPNNFYGEVVKPVLKMDTYYRLWESAKGRWGEHRASELISSIWDGSLYFHDSTKSYCPYCFGADTSRWLLEGRPYGFLPGEPPKRARSFVGQSIEITMELSQQFAGAIGLPNLLSNLAYFTHNMTDKEIENELQSFVHVAHNEFRTGGDSPFTNVSLFCKEGLKDFLDGAVYPDGSRPVNNLDEIMRVQKIYAKFFSKGSPLTGKPYRFPVTTVNIKKNPEGEIADPDFFEYMARLNAPRAIFNWHEGEKIATCCRLTSDLNELREEARVDNFGNGGVSLGSHRVVTVNLHRAALREGDFFDNIYEEAQKAIQLLTVHKKDIVQKSIDRGFLKFFDLGWANQNMFFSTIGFTGLYDSYELLHGKFDIEEYGHYAERVIDYLEGCAKRATKEHSGMVFNVEEIPGEGACPKLAKKDSIVYGTEKKILSNQMLPLYQDFSLFERLEVAGNLMDKVSGGAILHVNLDSPMTEKSSVEFSKLMIEDYGITHWAVNYGFTVCEKNHTTVGVYQVCPRCESRDLNYITRVVGFNTEVSDWNEVRRTEDWPKREWYSFS